MSNISSKIGSPTKVESTTISGVDIILGSNNYLANNNKKSNKIRKTVQNKAVRTSLKLLLEIIRQQITLIIKTYLKTLLGRNW